MIRPRQWTPATPLIPLLMIGLSAAIGHSAPRSATGQEVYSTDFTQADAQHSDRPAGWSLSGGKGQWRDRSVLEVTGSGAAENSNSWRFDGCRFVPGRVYHFQMRARRLEGSGGCAVSGPQFANRDYHDLSAKWKSYDYVFRAPDQTAGAYLRLGQWNTAGTFQFDSVRVGPVLPVYKATGGIVLGEGESISQGQYRFRGTFNHAGSNDHRTLLATTAGFNSNRWCFGSGSQVTYRFAVPGHKFLSGRVAFNVNYHTRGGCLAELSRDQNQWHALATRSELGTAQAQLPEALLPAETLFLRLRSSGGPASFQVDRVDFEAALDGQPADATGQTVYAQLEPAQSPLALEEITLEDAGASGITRLRMRVKNNGPAAAPVVLGATVGRQGAAGVVLPPQPAEIAPGKSAGLALDVPAQAPGQHRVELSLATPAVPGSPLRASLTFTVPDFYRADYGELLPGGSGDTAVWWCTATRKVYRRRPAPTATGTAARLEAARNDREAVQIVVRPGKPLRGLSATASPLVRQGPQAGQIPARNIRILRVYYHFVDHPTDSTGIRAWWPDALPPLDSPLDVEAGQNQPLWILVHVPRDAPAGDYLGKVQLKAEGFSADVPLALHVWNFTLPQRNHLETAFGLSSGNIFRYHNLKTEEDKRKVLDLYFQSFAEHRISPYDPTPLDPIRVKFLPQADPPRAELDFSAFDRAMARAVERFHFTSFRLPVQGMGGGTFHARYEPKIEGFGEKTPQYQAMFSDYVGKLQRHLQAKGWLEMAYVYWFDEPAPKDYPFVTAGMERLKRYAPGLRRMITEQPGDAFLAPINIWCPVSHNYDHAQAERRRAHGARFWWYVCTGPKAPYCTLFIDHPATDLRVWHWQAWQRNIVGTLVWQSNYWTSSAAFPDPAHPQNPYQDPMGYRSGYSTPKGVKGYWGNGDGRFLYPPLAAAVPGAAGSPPVLAPPVSSIRWEMLREGVEDYEYLYLLRELLAARADKLPKPKRTEYQALLDVPPAITTDMTTFTKDPAPIYAQRRRIAEAIQRLESAGRLPGSQGRRSAQVSRPRRNRRGAGLPSRRAGFRTEIPVSSEGIPP